MVGTEWCTNHGRVAARPVCICGDFMGWHSVHGADWVKLKTVLHTDIPMVHKTPSGTSMDMHVHVWVAWSVILVVVGASWGCAKSVVNLANFSPCPC